MELADTSVWALSRRSDQAGLRAWFDDAVEEGVSFSEAGDQARTAVSGLASSEPEPAAAPAAVAPVGDAPTADEPPTTPA